MWDMNKVESVINDSIIYPYEKALCQAIVLPVPKMNVKEISAEELKAIPSKRGEGMLGSSGK
jgi:dUTP pyrophosphatase